MRFLSMMTIFLLLRFSFLSFVSSDDALSGRDPFVMTLSCRGCALRVDEQDVFGEGGFDPVAFSEEVRPVHSLDVGVAQEVRRRMRKDYRGDFVRDASSNVVLEAHNYNVVDKRAARKSLAVSLVRDGLRQWLQSADGARWRSARDALVTDPDSREAADEEAPLQP